MLNEEKILEELNKFRKKVDKYFVGKTGKLPEEMDKIYDCDIYIYRHPGMGNSKQLIVGDKLSIITATSSYLETLLRNNVVTEKELKDVIGMAIKAAKGKLK